MKLFYSKGACSLAVRIVIHEIDVPCEFEEVNLKTKATKSGANFLEINPKGAVPVLITPNQEMLTENVVIQLYLADKFQVVQLLPPTDNFKHYRILEWLNYVSTDLHKSFGPLFNPSFTPEVKKVILEPVLEILRKKFEYVDQAISGKQYLLGDKFTLPDAYLFVVLRWLKPFNIQLTEFKNLASYFETVRNRPAVKR